MSFLNNLHLINSMIRTLQGIRKNFVKQNGLLFLSHKNKCNENSFFAFYICPDFFLW